MSNSNDFRFGLKQTMKGSWEYTEGGGIMYYSTNDRFVVLKTPTYSNYTSADIINMKPPVNMFHTPLIVHNGKKFLVFHEAWALFHNESPHIVEVFRKRYCEKYTDTILVNTYQIDGIHYLCVIYKCIIKHLISLMTEQLNINTEIDTLYIGVSHEGDKIHNLCTSGNIRHHFKINKELLKYKSDLFSMKSLSIKKITMEGHSMYQSLEFEGKKAAYLELTRQKSNLIDKVLGGHTEFTLSDLDIIEELIQEFDRVAKEVAEQEEELKCEISNIPLKEIVEKLQGIINIEYGKILEFTSQKTKLIKSVLDGNTEFTHSELDQIEEVIQQCDKYIKSGKPNGKISNIITSLSLEEIIEELQGIINIECGKTLWSYTEVRKVLSLWRSQTVYNVDKKTSLKQIQTAVLAYAKEEVDKKEEIYGNAVARLFGCPLVLKKMK